MFKGLEARESWHVLGPEKESEQTQPSERDASETKEYDTLKQEGETWQNEEREPQGMKSGISGT